eukprot:339050_1
MYSLFRVTVAFRNRAMITASSNLVALRYTSTISTLTNGNSKVTEISANSTPIYKLVGDHDEFYVPDYIKKTTNMSGESLEKLTTDWINNKYDPSETREDEDDSTRYINMHGFGYAPWECERMVRKFHTALNDPNNVTSGRELRQKVAQAMNTNRSASSVSNTVRKIAAKEFNVSNYLDFVAIKLFMANHQLFVRNGTVNAAPDPVKKLEFKNYGEAMKSLKDLVDDIEDGNCNERKKHIDDMRNNIAKDPRKTVTEYKRLASKYGDQSDKIFDKLVKWCKPQNVSKQQDETIQYITI